VLSFDGVVRRVSPSPLWGGVAPKAPGWGANEDLNLGMPHSAIRARTRQQAQSLRRRPTDAERKLWYLLRTLKPLGFHFRRQAPIGPFIADFVWYDGKLVIELDGSQHMEARRGYDARRTVWMNSQGYRVLRFWDNDVLKAPRSVGEAILAATSEIATMPQDPTPNPSPQGGGERTGICREGIA
jgi:very-short-patch-repair endonuclease